MLWRGLGSPLNVLHFPSIRVLHTHALTETCHTKRADGLHATQFGNGRQVRVRAHAVMIVIHLPRAISAHIDNCGVAQLSTGHQSRLVGEIGATNCHPDSIIGDLQTTGTPCVIHEYIFTI